MKKLFFAILLMSAIWSCNDSKKIRNIQCTAVDGKICYSIEERDSYNELQISKAASGGAAAEAAMKHKVAISNINNETIAKLMSNGENYETAKKAVAKMDSLQGE